jgi:hypothetical protein
MMRQMVLRELRELEETKNPDWVLGICHQGVYQTFHFDPTFNATDVAEQIKERYLDEDEFDKLLEDPTATIQVLRAPAFDPEEHNGGINWERLKQRVESDKEARFLLGSVFTVMPSRKYYQPFAASNVTGCPICEWKGNIPNLLAHAEIHQTNTEARAALTKTNVEKGLMWAQWPETAKSAAKAMDEAIKLASPTVQCPYCHGHTSREVYEDEIYREWLEEKAAEFGGWLESGEGDPCDIFICGKPPPSEEEDEEDDDGED